MEGNTSRPSGRVRGLVRFALFGLCGACALLPLGSAGCAADKTSVTVTSAGSRQRYEPAFTRAYAGRSQEGYDVVLADDAAAGSASSAPDSTGPTASGAAANVRQLMHIRVLWAPDRVVKANSPAATNASIRWFVFGETDGRTELLEYTGTGMVSIEPDGDTTTFTVRNATLTPARCKGSLCDLVGPSQFAGTVVARNNPQRVGELLSDVKTTLAAATMKPALTDGQAAASRAPVGP